MAIKTRDKNLNWEMIFMVAMDQIKQLQLLSSFSANLANIDALALINVALKLSDKVKY